MESEETSEQQEKKPWHASIAEDLQRTTDSAIRSARSLQHNFSTHLRSLQDFIPHMKSQYITYEDAFFKKAKDELMSAREHPAVAGGVAIAAGLLLMRGPRRFLFRHTLGRIRSEEAQFVRAEKNVKELNLSVDLMRVDLMKNDRKLLERIALAEKDTTHLRDWLREIPGRDALKHRAEVASRLSLLKQVRVEVEKRILKNSSSCLMVNYDIEAIELGIFLSLGHSIHHLNA